MCYFLVLIYIYICGVIECDEGETEEYNEYLNMGQDESFQLQCGIYVTSLPGWDVRNITPMNFCSTECSLLRTCCAANLPNKSKANITYVITRSRTYLECCSERIGVPNKIVEID